MPTVRIKTWRWRWLYRSVIPPQCSVVDGFLKALPELLISLASQLLSREQEVVVILHLSFRSIL